MDKNNYPILFLSFFIGLLVILPSLFSIYNIGSQNFQGVYPMFNDDEIHYLAMAKDIDDGHFLLGNAFIFEHKNDDFLQPPLAEIIFAKLAGIFHISIPAMFVINDFILPFLGVILLYLLFLNITGSKAISAISSFIFYLLFIFSFGRPINPQFSFIFLVSGLLLIWKIYSGEKIEEPARFARRTLIPRFARNSIKYNLLLGLVFGILIYIYPYFWTALLVVYALILFFKMKEWGIVNSSKSFLIFALTAGIIAVPYLINQYKVLKSLFYPETALRLGMLNIHLPGAYVNAGLLVLALLALYFTKGIGDSRKFNFSLILFLSGLILNWQNIIIGKYLQFSSHYYMVSVLFVFIALMAAVCHSESRARRISSMGEVMRSFTSLRMTEKVRSLAFILLVLVIFSFICYRQSGEIKTQLSILPGASKQVFLKQQQMADVFDWFNKNSAPDSVIMSFSDKYSAFSPIYTRNNLYSYGYAASYLMPDSEMEDRWVRQNIFNENVNAEYITAHHKEIWINKFIDRYQNEMVRQKIVSKLTGKKITEPELVPLEYINRVLEKYGEVRKEELRNALKKYEINYILLDLNDNNYKNLPSELEKYDFIEPVAKINNVLIYQVN